MGRKQWGCRLTEWGVFKCLTADFAELHDLFFEPRTARTRRTFFNCLTQRRREAEARGGLDLFDRHLSKDSFLTGLA